MPHNDLEYELIRYRATVVSVALQALIVRLTAAGTLNYGDHAAMREIGLELAEDLGRAIGRPEVTKRLSEETDGWWNAVKGLSAL